MDKTYEEKIAQLDLEVKRKKNSMKNKIAWYAMFLIPMSIIAQIALSYLESTVQLPLELIVGGSFSLIGLYFGVNFLQKKFIINEENSEE